MERSNEDVLKHATFGLVSLLEQKPYVCDIKKREHEPAQNTFLNNWEEGNDCRLPSDLKQFYLTMNGLLIQWKIKFNDAELPIGCVEINPIEALNSVALRSNKNDFKLQFLDFGEDEFDDNGHRKPRFHEKIFELSSDDKFGKVCLVYKDDCEDPKVWLLDLSLQWHYLASSFCQYYRMLITHLGIRGWQFLYTEFGLSPEVKQWFSYCLPHRLNGDKTNIHITSYQHTTSAGPIENNKVDFNALFKQKASGDKKGAEQNTKKKKSQAPVGSKPNRTTASNRPSSKLNKTVFK